MKAFSKKKFRLAYSAAHLLIATLLFSAIFLAFQIPSFAHNSNTHRRIMRLAFEIFQEIQPSLYASFSGCEGRCSETEETWTSRGSAYRRVSGDAMAQVIEEVGRLDYYRDLELIDVWGGVDEFPHSDRWDEIDDVGHYTEEADWYHLWIEAIVGVEGMNFTAFNHFIDIRKGPGLFEDYDGYSYYRGSGEENWWGIDGIIRWWFNDEYVHATGEPEYRNCSPSIERYHRIARDLIRDRLPRGDDDHFGRSVFLPVDNMASYWYDRFIFSRDPATLGPVLHALHDVSVPQHAAGFLGNWHANYENYYDENIGNWTTVPRYFKDSVISMVRSWNHWDPSPPTSIRLGEEGRTPAINWRIDQLVTWLALKAYRVYEKGIFDYWWGTPGSVLDEAWEPDAEELDMLTTAMSVLVLMKAARSFQPPLITSLNPAYSSPGYQSVTIQGDFFFPYTKVDFGNDIALRKKEIVSEQEIQLMLFIEDDAATGLRQCKVQTRYGESAAQFSVNPPARAGIRSVTPSSCPQGGSVDVVISGEEFWDIEAIEFGDGISVQRFQLVDQKTIRATLSCAQDAEIGFRDVVVRKRGASPGVGDNLFRVVSPPIGSAPFISSVEPNSAQQGEHLTVVIRGLRLSDVNRADFGEGITVKKIYPETSMTGTPPYASIHVRDDVVKVLIEINNLARVGPRTVFIYTSSGHYATTRFAVTVYLR